MAGKNTPKDDFWKQEPRKVSFSVVGNVRLSEKGKALNLMLTARPSKNMSIPISDILKMINGGEEGRNHIGAIRSYEPGITPEEE